MSYRIGEKPGRGTYVCDKCNTKVTLDDNTDALPPCPKCGRGQDTTYSKA